MEMTLRGANDVQAFTAESRLPVLPLAALPTVQSDAALQPNMDCLPFHSVMHGQVMTDEQLETLRLQISVYATICQQLVEMHKAIMAQQSAIPGIRSGQPTPYDSVIYTMGHKLTSRQRWNPRQTQLQILEILFEQGNGTPNKQRIKEITAELSQHGPISETNVYNWFQNRRARTKRKQQVELPNTGESEVDTDVDSKKEKKVMREKDPMYESLSTEQSETNFRSTEGGMGTVQVDDRYWLDSQRILHSETIHAAIDVNPGAAFRRAVSDADEHGYAPRSLQDSQGQMVSKNWAEESLKLLHSEKNHSLAGLGNGDVTAKTIPSEGILKPSAEQVSGIMREVCLIGLNNGPLVCNQSQSQLRG